MPFKIPCCVWFWLKYSNFTYPLRHSKSPAAFDIDSNIQILLIRCAIQNPLLRLILIQILKFYLSIVPFKIPCCVWFWFKYSNFTYPLCHSKSPAAFGFDSNIKILLIHCVIHPPCCVWFWFKYSNFTFRCCLNFQFHLSFCTLIPFKRSISTEFPSLTTRSIIIKTTHFNFIINWLSIIYAKKGLNGVQRQCCRSAPHLWKRARAARWRQHLVACSKL